jgi:hypothetical protein
MARFFELFYPLFPCIELTYHLIPKVAREEPLQHLLFAQLTVARRKDDPSSTVGRRREKQKLIASTPAAA